MTDEKLNTKVITPEIPCSYPNLAEPANEEYGGKYALSIPFPKSDEKALALLKAAMSNAAVNAWGVKYKELKGVKTFVEDCDEDPKYDDDTMYKGCLKFSAKGKKQPGMVYPDMTPVEKEKIEDVFYPGAIVRASISAYATETGGGKTVAFGLNNVMFVKDGDRIGGAVPADSDFGDFKDDSFVNDPFTPGDGPGSEPSNTLF